MNRYIEKVAEDLTPREKKEVQRGRAAYAPSAAAMAFLGATGGAMVGTASAIHSTVKRSRVFDHNNVEVKDPVIRRNVALAAVDKNMLFRRANAFAKLGVGLGTAAGAGMTHHHNSHMDELKSKNTEQYYRSLLNGTPANPVAAGIAAGVLSRIALGAGPIGATVPFAAAVAGGAEVRKMREERVEANKYLNGLRKSAGELAVPDRFMFIPSGHSIPGYDPVEMNTKMEKLKWLLSHINRKHVAVAGATGLAVYGANKYLTHKSA